MALAAAAINVCAVALAAAVLTYVRVESIRRAATRALVAEQVEIDELRVSPLQMTPTPSARFTGRRHGESASGIVVVGTAPFGPPANTETRILWDTTR